MTKDFEPQSQNKQRKTINSSTEFDFDKWMRLAEQDPKQFEQNRKVLIKDLLQSASKNMQNRLNGLQFQVDMEILKAKTPMTACLRITEMMWNTILKDGGLIDAIDALQGKPSTFTDKTKVIRSAKVIALKPKHSK